MKTELLSPYDREFLAQNRIAPDVPEHIADPEPGPAAFVGIRNAMILEFIVAAGVGFGLALFYALPKIWVWIWRFFA